MSASLLTRARVNKILRLLVLAELESMALSWESGNLYVVAAAVKSWPPQQRPTFWRAMNHFNHEGTIRFPIGVDLQRLGELLSTEPVRFIVGAERAEFHLHGGLVASLSAPLHALVNRQRIANMQDTSTAVFSRFAQFVYSGHYDLETSVGKGVKDADGHMRTQRNILVQHAQLWVFAQMYQIETLKGAVQTQLTNKLTIGEMSPVTFCSEFGELVYYVYGASLRFELRQIVSQFAATVAPGLYHLAGWRELLMGCPGFSWDVLQAMRLLESF